MSPALCYGQLKYHPPQISRCLHAVHGQLLSKLWQGRHGRPPRAVEGAPDQLLRTPDMKIPLLCCARRDQEGIYSLLYIEIYRCSGIWSPATGIN